MRSAAAWQAMAKSKHGVSGMEHAAAGHLTFLNPKYAPKVKHTRASAILVSEALHGQEIACLVSGNPYLDFSPAPSLPSTNRPGLPRAFIPWPTWRPPRGSGRTAPSGPSR